MRKSMTANPTWTKLNILSCRKYLPGLRENCSPVTLMVITFVGMHLCLDLNLYLTMSTIPAETVLPLNRSSAENPCYISPFCHISTKTLFLGPMDFYVHKPIAIILNNLLGLDAIFSANFISGSHIMFAVVGAYYLAQESLNIRRFGFVIFEFRNMLDSLDGVIARAEAARRKEQARIMSYAVMEEGDTITITNSGVIDSRKDSSHFTLGFFIDGLCDGLGCIFLTAACLIFLERHSRSRKNNNAAYTALKCVTVEPVFSSNCDYVMCNDKGKRKSKVEDDDTSDDDPIFAHQKDLPLFINFSSQLHTWTRIQITNVSRWLVKSGRTICSGMKGGPGLPAFLYLLQITISSGFWNRNIFLYSKILERPTNDSAITPRSVSNNGNPLSSTFLWCVIMAWRTVNPLAMTEYLLFAIVFDRMGEFLRLFKWSGFVIVFVVAAISEVCRVSLVTL